MELLLQRYEAEWVYSEDMKLSGITQEDIKLNGFYSEVMKLSGFTQKSTCGTKKLSEFYS